MEQEFEHTFLKIRGLIIHTAHKGKGKLGTVVFLHGFPEIWYSWRHQMIAAAAAGFQAIAPDFRGYGLSDQPPDPASASLDDLLADLLAILDALSISKAFVVGKDFGVRPAYQFAISHPSRVCGVITLGIPFSITSFASAVKSPGFYISRWREPGRPEADFGRFDIKSVVRTVYVLFSRSEIPIAEEGQEIMDLADSSTPLPAWLPSMLLSMRNQALPIHSKCPTGDPKVEAPSLLIMGEKDCLQIPRDGGVHEEWDGEEVWP